MSMKTEMNDRSVYFPEVKFSHQQRGVCDWFLGHLADNTIRGGPE
jgi:hypothetical protein